MDPPGALKGGGALPKLSIFLSQLKGGPFGEKNNFRKKSHNAEKLKGGPFEIFKHTIYCKISKKLKGDPLERKKLERKVSQCRKTERGPFGVFQHPLCRKTSKN